MSGKMGDGMLIMVKKKVDKVEWYPVYRLVDSGPRWMSWLEFTKDEIKFIEDAEDAFDKAQSLMVRKLKKEEQ